jgi:plastocyanin domain-containing protein
MGKTISGMMSVKKLQTVGAFWMVMILISVGFNINTWVKMGCVNKDMKCNLPTSSKEIEAVKMSVNGGYITSVVFVVVAVASLIGLKLMRVKK